MRKALTLIFLALASCSLMAQDMQGILNNTYTGFNSITLNPATSVSTPYYLEIDPVTIGAFADNDYLYLAKKEYKFSRFFTGDSFPSHPPYGQIFYDNYDHRLKNAFVNLRLRGPSASITIGKNSFGFTTAVRSANSVTDVPYEMGRFFISSLHYDNQWDINYKDYHDFDLNSLTWLDLGLNYSRVLYERYMNYYTAGISVRYLRGLAGAYLHSDNIDYMVKGGDTLIVYNANIDAGLSLPVDPLSNAFPATPLFGGGGVAFDLGFMYEKKKTQPSNPGYSSLCSQQYIPYEYKIGVSLIDLGFIRFKNNAFKMELNDAQTFWPGINSTTFDNINQQLSNIDWHFNGGTSTLVIDHTISMGLPTAISLQGDYNFGNNLYVGGVWIHPVKIFNHSVTRPSFIAVNPRYETRRFAVTMPLTVYRYKQPRLGLSLRLGGFFIGTDKLGSFFNLSDFTGMDFYMGIRITFLKGNCRKKAQTSCGNNEYKKFVRSKKEMRPKKLENY